jgi:hypothetical protein
MMGRFREENDENQQTIFNQHHIFELSGKKPNFCEFGNLASLENLHLSPNLFSEIQRMSSEIAEQQHEVPKIPEIRVGKNYQAGLPNNKQNEGMTYEEDDDFTEGELVSYPSQKREREETEDEMNEFDLDLSLLEDKISSPKKKFCLQVPNISLGAPIFDLSDNYPGESLSHSFGNLETIFNYPYL